MMKESKDIDEIKKVIRSLLLSTKHGLTVNELCSEYNIITSKVIPYKALGYFSAIDLVKDMPDVVQPVFHRDGSMLLRGIADQYTAHIKALVHGQKSVDTPSKLYTPQQILSGATKKTVSSFIQSKILFVLKDHPSGLEIDAFENAYVQEYGKKINPLLQGYTSIQSLLGSCSDILKLVSKDGGVLIYPLKETKVGENLSTSRCNISNEMRKDIFSVLMKHNHNNGILASQFNIEFNNHHRKDLDFQVLGFNSIIELVSKLSDMVDIERPSSESDWLLIPKMFLLENNGIVSRMNYQYTTFSPGEINEQIEICVTYIINPSLFWFQLTQHLPSLYTLMEDMNYFYQSSKGEHLLPTECIVVGHPCAARYSDNQWYRAIIKNILPCETVNVFFVDYGDSLDVQLSCVCILRTDFVFLPSQAIAARLNIRCDWSKDLIKRFFELTHDKELSATIVDKNRIMSVEIINSDSCNVGAVLKKEIKLIQVESTSEVKCSSQLPAVSPLDEKCNEKENIDIPEEHNELETDYVFVKCLRISEDYIVHIIHNGDTPCIISAEISRLFWDGDILKHMLQRKGIQLKSNLLFCIDNKELFSALVRYSVNGIYDRNVVRTSISTYKLTVLPYIFSIFVSKYPTALTVINEEVELFNTCSSTDYWRNGVSVVPIPEEEKENLLQKLHALQYKKKQLYQKIMTNCAEVTTLEEIKNIDEEISGFQIQ